MLRFNISNAPIGKECGTPRVQRAAGWCEAVRVRTKSPLSRVPKAKASKQPRFSAVNGKCIVGCTQRCRREAASRVVPRSLRLSPLEYRGEGFF
jgi:hypothetical protein